MPRPILSAGPADGECTLTLLAPGLTGADWPERPAELLQGLDLSCLERLLARADREVVGVSGLYPFLRRAFALERGPSEDEEADFPVAALTLYSDTGTRPRGYWLRADPVHIQTGQDRLIMGGSDGLALEAAEAQTLVAEINGHMATEGLSLLAPAPDRWYFRWSEAPEVCFTPLPEVIGRDLYPHMPGGAAGRPWRSRLNEIQMLLHASRVNAERRAGGRRREINGVWIWGGGELPAARACGYREVWADDPLVRGLALNAGLEPQAVPVDATAWLSEAGPGAHLLVIDALQAPRRLGEVEAWRDALLTVQAQWLAPLAAALRRRRIGRLLICPADGAGYHVTPGALRRFWRRRRPLTAWQ